MKKFLLSFWVLSFLLVVGCTTPSPNKTGLEHFQKGEDDQAINDFSAAIVKDPDNSELYNNRGIAYMYAGNYDQSISDFSKAIELKPDCTFYNNRGKAYAHRSQYNLAIADYTKAIEINPEDYLAFINRADAYFQIGSVDNAVVDLDFVISNGDDLSVKIAKNKLNAHGVK